MKPYYDWVDENLTPVLVLDDANTLKDESTEWDNCTVVADGELEIQRAGQRSEALTLTAWSP